MVKKYTADEIRGDIYYTLPDDAEFVCATDYAALEAERDALARRINPDGAPVDVAALCLEIDTVTDERDEWRRRTYRIVGHIEEADSIDLHAVIAIAEGRDNG